MWALFSSRLRTWVLFAFAIPIVRYLVHRFAESAQRRRPGARSTSVLSHADSTVASFANRPARRKDQKASR